MAVVSRFMWGLLNGNIGVAKTYLAEICDDTNSAKGMALFGVIGGLGRSIGPIIGGFLSSPAKVYPKTFEGTVFETFPFALPSLVIAVNCLFVFIVSYFTLSETLPLAMKAPIREATHGDNKDRGGTYSLLQEKDEDEEENLSSDALTETEDGVEMTKHNSLRHSSKGSSSSIASAVIDEEEESKDSLFETPNKKRKLTFAGVVTVKTIGSQALGFGPLKGIDSRDQPLRLIEGREVDDDDIELGESHILDDGARSPPYSPLQPGTSHTSGNFNASNESVTVNRSLLENTEETSKLMDPHHEHRQIVGKVRYSNGSEDETVITRGRGFWTMLAIIFQQPEIMISTILYGTNALSIIVFNEIFPLWVVTAKSSGGFEFTSYQIGVSTMISGVLGIVLQVTLYPYMTDRLGVLFVHKAGVLAFALSCIAVPCASLVNSAHSSFLTWVAIVGSQLLINVTSTWVLVSVFVLINNSCYSYQRATVNGLGQTFASLGRLMGPYVGANIFAWSENNHMSWPFNFYLTFYLMAIIGFGNWLLANRLPWSIQRRKKEPGVPMPPRRRRHRYEDEDDSDSVELQRSPIHPQPHLPPQQQLQQQEQEYAKEQVNLNKGQGIPMP